MKRIIIPPQPKDIPLQFYLATEEWVARNLPAGEYFFAWQTEPTVICGRHQDIPSEVDIEYASSHNIRISRRKSGGGAVYADRSNVMFSYITPSDAVQTIFGNYTSMICRMLGSLGIEAEPTGRNDISIGGRKVAGNAFLKLPGRSVVHGTMLYDADFDTMSKVLTPSRAKILSKGVVSVPSRITTLVAERIKLDCMEFIDYAVDYLCKEGEYRLTDENISEINVILKSYFDPSFFDKEPTRPKTTINSKYIDGIGQIAIEFKTASNGIISDVDLKGDFFPIGDISLIENCVKGMPYHKEAVEDALKELPLDMIIAGLNHENIKELLPNKI